VKRETDGQKYYNLGHTEDMMQNQMLASDDDLGGPKTLAGEPR
jgi:hypothetical protein